MTAWKVPVSGACSVRRHVALAFGLAVLWPGSARAQAPLPAAEKAAAVLATHCAGCHQSGQTRGRTPDRFDNVLRLDEIALDENLVLPGRPDASRLYQRLIGTHAPLAAAVRDSGGTMPAPDEIEAVRDWIDGLPPRADLCAGRPFVSPAASAESMRAWLNRLNPVAAADTRFISLIHLYNLCTSHARLAEYRAAVGGLLNRLSRRPDLLTLETVGDSSALLAFKLSDLGWQPAEWDALAGAAAVGEEPRVVSADRLAARVLARGGDPGLEISVPHIRALAREFAAGVGPNRAAAEAGIEPEPFAALLRDYGGEHEDLARRLLYGLLARADWERLRASMLPSAVAITSGEPRPPQDVGEGIDLALWTDSARYKAGDLVTFIATASQGCHLTLISVDRDGKAIVLFPNDLETDNAIAPNIAVRVPGAGAAYQLRFDRAGPETVVGICETAASTPQGITFNYEKQRFAVLGDWRTFLRTATRRERDPRRSGDGSARRKSKAEVAPIDPDGPGREGRTAITVTVEEAPIRQAAPGP